MPLYDYRCETTGHAQESIQPMSCDRFLCLLCCDVAVRQSVYRVAVTQPQADTRGMFRRFTEASQEIDHAATRIEQSTGQPVQIPNLYGEAKQQARAMIAAGENPHEQRS